MKTAIFIKETRQQIVLTPENKWEKNICKTLSEKSKNVSMYFAQFNDVQGGWTMFENSGYRGEDEDSLMIVLDDNKTESRDCNE